jgi:hypothetical protein
MSRRLCVYPLAPETGGHASKLATQRAVRQSSTVSAEECTSSESRPPAIVTVSIGLPRRGARLESTEDRIICWRIQDVGGDDQLVRANVRS